MTRAQEIFRSYLKLLPIATVDHFRWNVLCYPPPKVLPPVGIAIDRGMDEYGRDIIECGVGRNMGDWVNWSPSSGGNPKPDPVYHGADYRFGDYPDLTCPEYLTDIEPRVIPLEKERFRLLRQRAEEKPNP